MSRRLVEVSAKLLLRRPQYDIAVAGFFGQPLVPLLKKLSPKPIVFDAFVSAYDTLCFDRKVACPSSPIGKAAYWLDKSACSQSSRIVADTQAHAQYFGRTFDVSQKKITKLYLGYDNSVFFPREKTLSGPFQVFFYGTFLPLHGIEYIVKAAKLVQKETDIRFLIVGKGRAHSSVRQLANDLSAHNIEFVDWIPYEKLPKTISNSSICLGGHFSNSEKAKRVIAGKTYQFLAMEKPTIVGDCAANKELFRHEEHVIMCEQANEYALADAILKLKREEELCDHIARNGRELVDSLFNNDVVEENLRKIIELAIH